MTEPYDTLPCDVEPPSDRRKNHNLRKLIKIGDAMAKSLMNCMGVTARGVWEEWTVLVPKMRQPAYKPDGMLRKASDDRITVQVGHPKKPYRRPIDPHGLLNPPADHPSMAQVTADYPIVQIDPPLEILNRGPVCNARGFEVPFGTYTQEEFENYPEKIATCERCGIADHHCVEGLCPMCRGDSPELHLSNQKELAKKILQKAYAEPVEALTACEHQTLGVCQACRTKAKAAASSDGIVACKHCGRRIAEDRCVEGLCPICIGQLKRRE